MVTNADALFKALSRVVTSARISVERPGLRQRVGPKELRSLGELLIALHKVASALHVLGRSRKNKSAAELVVILPRVGTTLKELIASPTLMQTAMIIPFVNRPLMSGVEKTLPDLQTSRHSVGQVLEQLARSIENGLDSEADVDIDLTCPAQVPAPIQFDITADRLLIRPQPVQLKNRDARTIQIARQELSAQLNEITKELASSNCDRRLLAAGERLAQMLGSEVDIISVGLHGYTLRELSLRLSDELPTAVMAMVSAHESAFRLYLAHFPEWNGFRERADQIELTEAQVSSIAQVSTRVVDELEKTEGLVDPKIPQTIRYIQEAINTPGAFGRRLALGLITILENLFISAYGFSNNI